MESQIVIVLILNFIIALIGTLAYSTRLVGIRTGKVAIAFAVFNVLIIISRTAGSFQAPLLTKFSETSSTSTELIKFFI